VSDESKPIPFKKLEYDGPPPDVQSPPTSRRDCEIAGGHGGADGKRTYTVDGKLICEICGEVDIGA
jgi:hypothetical protein